MGAEFEVKAVGPAEVDAVGTLFASARTTSHCWCMSFCSSPARFAAGWFGGGNRRRFLSMAQGRVPMGVVAFAGATPVGWAACGPRSRYLWAEGPGIACSVVGREPRTTAPGSHPACSFIPNIEVAASAMRSSRG